MSHFSGNLRFKLQSSLKHYILLAGTVRFNSGPSEPGGNQNQYKPQEARHQQTAEGVVDHLILIISQFNYFNISFLHCWKCNSVPPPVTIPATLLRDILINVWLNQTM